MDMSVKDNDRELTLRRGRERQEQRKEGGWASRGTSGANSGASQSTAGPMGISGVI